MRCRGAFRSGWSGCGHPSARGTGSALTPMISRKFGFGSMCPVIRHRRARLSGCLRHLVRRQWSGIHEVGSEEDGVTTAEFLERFAAVAGDWRMKLPTTVIEAWGQFVESCEAGYRDILDEFTFDRWVRHQIEKVPQDQGLREFDQMRWVEEQVREIDE